MEEPITRLAPSPTGAMHLGNARTFVLNYLLARKNGWRVLMRIEDLDGPRVKKGATEQALEDLRWLGLEWEEPVICQSGRHEAYAHALDRLTASGDAYPCTCSRKDVELAAGAPHDDDAVTIYPGTCRDRWTSPEQARQDTGRDPAWRVRVHDKPLRFNDRFAGDQGFTLTETCGDFVVYRGEGMASYQLAVILDDTETGVNRIVRGDDLLESTGRQIHLRNLLDLDGDQVEYWHVPLVVGEDGRRLAKRHGDTRLASFRDGGTPPQRVLGLIAAWFGIAQRPEEMDLSDLIERFDPDRIPADRIVFTRDDDAFLKGS